MKFTALALVATAAAVVAAPSYSADKPTTPAKPVYGGEEQQYQAPAPAKPAKPVATPCETPAPAPAPAPGYGKGADKPKKDEPKYGGDDKKDETPKQDAYKGEEQKKDEYKGEEQKKDEYKPAPTKDCDETKPVQTAEPVVAPTQPCDQTKPAPTQAYEQPAVGAYDAEAGKKKADQKKEYKDDGSLYQASSGVKASASFAVLAVAGAVAMF